jgi:prefoldin subunit 5
MDIKELKAQAYDCLAQIQFLQRQLELVNQEIAKLSKDGSPSVEEAPASEPSSL